MEDGRRMKKTKSPKFLPCISTSQWWSKLNVNLCEREERKPHRDILERSSVDFPWVYVLKSCYLVSKKCSEHILCGGLDKNGLQWSICFNSLFPSWRNCLGRIGRCGLAEKVCHWGLILRLPMPMPFPVVSLCFIVLHGHFCLPMCFHALQHDIL